MHHAYFDNFCAQYKHFIGKVYYKNAIKNVRAYLAKTCYYKMHIFDFFVHRNPGSRNYKFLRFLTLKYWRYGSQPVPDSSHRRFVYYSKRHKIAAHFVIFDQAARLLLARKG